MEFPPSSRLATVVVDPIPNHGTTRTSNEGSFNPIRELYEAISRFFYMKSHMEWKCFDYDRITNRPKIEKTNPKIG
jgi:hypothetical protein